MLLYAGGTVSVEAGTGRVIYLPEYGSHEGTHTASSIQQVCVILSSALFHGTKCGSR